MSEWKLKRASARMAAVVAKNAWSSEQLESLHQALETEISAALWPCAELQMEFRGFKGYNAIVTFQPTPKYNAQEGTVLFGRPFKGNPLLQLKIAFDKARQGQDLRLLLQTTNGGVLNLTDYAAQTPLKSLWLPTWLWKVAFDELCTVNKHIQPLLDGIMLLLPSANQSTYDLLKRAVIANQWELREKEAARDPEESLLIICASELAGSVCSSIDCDTFFDKVAA